MAFVNGYGINPDTFDINYYPSHIKQDIISIIDGLRRERYYTGRIMEYNYYCGGYELQLTADGIKYVKRIKPYNDYVNYNTTALYEIATDINTKDIFKAVNTLKETKAVNQLNKKEDRTLKYKKLYWNMYLKKSKRPI